MSWMDSDVVIADTRAADKWVEDRRRERLAREAAERAEKRKRMVRVGRWILFRRK